MNELNTLIQQTKEEIEIKEKNIKKEYLDIKLSMIAKIKRNYQGIDPEKKFLEMIQDTIENEPTILILQAKLSALQTAQDIFIKMLDENSFLCSKTGDNRMMRYMVDVESIKSQLLGGSS